MIDVMRDLIQNPTDARPLHLMNMDAAGEQENIDDEAIAKQADHYAKIANRLEKSLPPNQIQM